MAETQKVEYITTDEIEETQIVDPEAWVVVADLNPDNPKPLKIKAKDLLYGVSEGNINLDGGSFI
jgi:hypothetical protein